MQELIELLLEHINGISGLTNPMIEPLVKNMYKELSPRNKRCIHGIINTYIASDDEDEKSTAIYLKMALL